MAFLATADRRERQARASAGTAASSTPGVALVASAAGACKRTRRREVIASNSTYHAELPFFSTRVGFTLDDSKSWAWDINIARAALPRRMEGTSKHGS